jgi:hypothetical protein
MKVLIVCEDPTHDPFIVRPVVDLLLADLGFTVTTSVLDDPHLRGIDDLLQQLPDIAQDNKMVQLIVVVVDNDCDRTANRARLAHARARDPRIVTCCALEEVEIWMLALHRDVVERQSGARWPEVRANCDVKEAHALSFLQELNGAQGPGRGRKAAMRALGTRWKGLLQLCDELATLRQDIAAAVASLRARG